MTANQRKKPSEETRTPNVQERISKPCSDAVQIPPPLGLFFESASVRSWYNGSTVLPVLRPGVLDPASGLSASDLSEATGMISDHTPSVHGNPPSTVVHSRQPQVQRVNSNVYTQQELLQMDQDMAFVIPTPDHTQKLRSEAVAVMKTASEEMKPCCVCELSIPCSTIKTQEVTDEFIALMRQCLIVHPHAEIPSFIVAQYSVSSVDSRLQGLLLYRPAIFVDSGRIQMRLCASCKAHIESRKYHVPPSNAIANGNYIGFLPSIYQGLTRTDEQAIALVLPCVSLSVVSGGTCKTIKSHHYVVQNTEGPIVEMLPRDLASRIRITMVGSMTPAQVAACKKKYELNLPLCRRYLRFLKTENVIYKRQSEAFNAPPPANPRTMPTSVIIDRTATTDLAPDSAEVITSLRDESTYSSFGSEVQEGEDHTIEHTWIGASSFLFQPHQPSWADVLVRKSNVYQPMAKWAVCVKMFPTLFPGGCGGPVEPRLNSMSVRKWILRCLRVYGHRFESHHAFMLLAFDYLASENARRTLCEDEY